MEVKFTFRAEVYITADSLADARQEFANMRILAAEALEHDADIIEVYDEEIQEEC